jgi:hypothetical protein
MSWSALAYLALLWLHCALGTVYFVDKDGIGGPCADTNPGTITAPYCNPYIPNSKVQPGDTIYFRKGNWTGHHYLGGWGITGQPGKRITYSAYNNETVFFHGCTGLPCGAFITGSYMTVHGITFSYTERGISIQYGMKDNICELLTDGCC